MEKIRSWAGTFLLAVLAGVSISIGCIIYLTQENHVAGSFLFSMGLMTICVFRWNLYTGKVGYISYRDPQKLLWIFIIWLGNLAGTFAAAAAMLATRHAENLKERVLNVVQPKLGDSYPSLFLLAVFCGILMYIAVEGFRSNPHSAGKYLAIIFSVMVFILSGFEHCVANMFYFWLAGMTGKSMICLAVMTLGNTVGGAGVAWLHRTAGRLIEEPRVEKSDSIPN